MGPSVHCAAAAQRQPLCGPGYLRAVRLLLCSVLIAALVAVDASVARGQTPPCKEVEKTQPAPENAKNLVELQSNAARPTFDVQLDSRTKGDDNISFTPQAGARPGSTADVAAEFTDAPRYKGERLGGQEFIAAHASESGRRIVVEACFENVPSFTAGRYEGTTALFGPKLADFNYAIVVTTKWPRWVAWSLIGLTFVAALLIAGLTGQFQSATWTGRAAYAKIALTVLLALGLAVLTYWSVYASNETWGSTPASDLVALVSATFAAAIGGIATAKKLLSPS